MSVHGEEGKLIPELIPLAMPAQPAPSIVEALTPIWERVLGRSPIGATDNFFDLGGDSLSAVTLFLEIEKLCGRQLPSVMIYNAPTITALAAELSNSNTSRFPPLFLLRAGSAAPPVFIAHGLGGSVIDFYRLVTHIQSDRPIYGMQARGIDGADDPFESIEDMAQYHLDAIRKIQPRGPYSLVGYSLGGLESLEIACRLVAVGERVALLAMLDAYPFRTYLTLRQRMQLSLRLIFERMFAGNRVTSPSRSAATASLTPAMERAANVAKIALTHYRPHFYPGKINFIRAEIVTDFPANPVAVWAGLAKEVICETVPGDHLGMIANHPENLAAVISRCLEKANA